MNGDAQAVNQDETEVGEPVIWYWVLSRPSRSSAIITKWKRLN